MASGLSHRRVIIVGAGQSGLAVAAALRAQGLQPQQDFAVIDAAAPGRRSWADRSRGMELLSDARHSALPVRRLPGDQRRRPLADEMADYLTFVEAALGVETRWRVRAHAVSRRGNGPTLHLTTSAGEVQTRNVVCATGAAARPHCPEWAERLSIPGVILHSSQFPSPEHIPPGDVLIVGGGTSGAELALKLSDTHPVTLSVRTARWHRQPSAHWRWAGASSSWLSKGRAPEPRFGVDLESLRRRGVTTVPAVSGADGAAVVLADRTRFAPTSVILATGFHPADNWLPADARVRGSRRTTTAMPGLFVAGMPQFGGAGADTISGVWRDATAIARQILDRP